MPPSPIHVFRFHAHPVHCSAFSTDNRLLYAGDEDGWITITDLKVKRVVAHWKAHEAGVLGVADWQGGHVSHGRDNIIHFHAPLDLSSSPTQTSPPFGAASSSIKTVATTNGYRNLLSPPRIIRSLPVNSLNFCGFHLIPVPTGYELDIPVSEELDQEETVEPVNEKVEQKKHVQNRFMQRWNKAQGLLAVPNLTDSETIDIYHLPSFGRLHAAVSSRGKAAAQAQREGKPRTGLVMSTHLYFTTPQTPYTDPPSVEHPKIHDRTAQAATFGQTVPADRPLLRLVAAFEDGRVEHWECQEWSKRTDPRMSGTRQGESSAVSGGWRNLWTQKVHNEAVMALAVSPTLDYAYTVSADHQVVKYDLQQNPGVQGDAQSSPTRFPTKQIGNAAIAVSPDGRVVAVGGWDGSVRLFSARTFKSLGTLSYHRETCHTISFPKPNPSRDSTEQPDDASVIEVVEEVEDDSSSDDEDSARKGGKEDVMRWMITGGKDRRVALWQLKDFAKK